MQSRWPTREDLLVNQWGVPRPDHYWKLGRYLQNHREEPNAAQWYIYALAWNQTIELGHSGWGMCFDSLLSVTTTPSGCAEYDTMIRIR
jgi:hypothetical protein